MKRFVANYSTLTHPLRQLTKKDTVFEWTADCENAFQVIIHALSERSSISYFDEKKDTFVYCDASPVGISAILLQRTPGKNDLQIINFSSRSLTATESRYSQIERECLGILYACEKNRLYLLGRKFTLYNDHKALINLLNNTSSKLPLRLERMILRLQGYDFTASHVTSDQNISDYISRHPREDQSIATSYIDAYVNMVTKFATPKAFKIEDIATATRNEVELKTLKEMIVNNNWYTLDEPQKHEHLQHVNIELLRRFRRIKDELTVDVQHNIILKGNRIILPSKFHKDAVTICHVGHQGIEKTKKLLRTKVFFFGMDKMVEDLISNCISCQCTGPSKPHPPIQTTDIPDNVWDTIHMDYLGPVPVVNKYVLVMMDKRSRYPEIAFVNNTSAKSLINVLHKTFSAYGIPAKIITDNGPPFTSNELRHFMEENGIVHHRITPRWPQANGQVENFNKPLMKTIRAAYIERKDIETECYKFLRQYRATPHTVTKIPPAELMFQRTPRHVIPHIPLPCTTFDDLKQRDSESKAKSAAYVNAKRNAKNRTVRIGDQVLLKQQKLNKLSPSFEAKPYHIIAIKGTMITVKDNYSDRTLTRNISHFKPLPWSAELPRVNGGREDMSEEDDNGEDSNKRNPAPKPRKQYPKRNRRPVSEWRKY